MQRVNSWLYGKKLAADAANLLDEATVAKDCCVFLIADRRSLSGEKVDEAMKAATHILNDDVDSAEDGLAVGDSTFHNLGKGMVAFIRATLGFEQDIMRQASERLSEAETTAASEQQRAQQNSDLPNLFHSEIYTSGTEYALVQAVAQLMGAVIGVLNESLTEGIKAFYRLRKAYMTLDAILKMEEKFMELRDPSREQLPRSSTNGTNPVGKVLSRTLSGLTLSQITSNGSDTSVPSGSNPLNHDPDSEIFKNDLDVFIHSGANFCFGILLLIISMIPPAFSKLLAIVGFRGDKQRGLRMIWQASKFHNFIGAMAALALLGYYNGFVRYCDIMPDPAPGEEDYEGIPQERLAALLVEMRSRFPNSRLWLLEASRMKGANKDLEGALELLSSGEKSPLKQVEALCVFEKSMNSMFVHKYEVCADAFIHCSELNSWSRSLYWYIAGSCQVVQYRDALAKDPEKAEFYAQRAAEYIRKAPPFAGKKRFMTKQLPFDVFVARKIAKWEARAKEWDVPLVDAIGVDPVEEMIYFWNGYGRMTDSQLEDSLARLAWCESDSNKTWTREGPEEKAMLELLRAAVHRSLHNHEEAKRILRTRLLSLDKSIFKGPLKDDYVQPAGHFEMAANLWMERPTWRALHSLSGPGPSENSEDGLNGTSNAKTSLADEREMVRECKEYLGNAARWETYVLDARIGIKLTAAMEAVNKWERQHPAV